MVKRKAKSIKAKPAKKLAIHKIAKPRTTGKAFPPASEPRVMRNRLTFADMYRLTEWIKQQKQATLRGKTRKQIAQMAGDTLGMSIADSSVTMALDTLGIDVGRGSPSVGKVSQADSLLASCVHDLYIAIGKQVPVELDDLVQRNPIDTSGTVSNS